MCKYSATKNKSSLNKYTARITTMAGQRLSLLLLEDYAEVVCSVLAFLLYLNTLNAGFVYDDRRAILSNPDVTGHTALSQLLLHDFWGTPLQDSGSHGSWRPLCVLTFRLNFQLGLGAFGFHLINVLLHCCATWLLVKVARTLLTARWAALAAGALFATHPVHTEAVAGLVGRADLAACICYLLAYLAYQQHMSWRECNQLRQWSALLLTLLLALAALLCKETGITALLLCGLQDVLHGLRRVDKHRLRSLCILSVALLCGMYCRLSLLPLPTAHIAAADNPAAHAASWCTRLYTLLYLPVFNFRLLLWPQVLSFDWSMSAIPCITTLWDWRNLLSLAFYAALLGIVWKSMRLPALRLDYAAMASISLPLLQQLSNSSCLAWPEASCSCSCSGRQQSPATSTTHSRSWAANTANHSQVAAANSCNLLLICCAFLVLPFLPASNLFFYVGFVVAERLLYLPSIGYCLLIGYGFGQLWQQLRGNRQHLLLASCLGLLLCSFSLRTWQRNADWRTEEQLYRSAIDVNPAKALGNLGSLLSSQGRFEQAKLALHKALAHRPNMAEAHFNLGIVHQQQQNYSAALPCYRQAIQLRPQLAVAYLNLGTSLLALQRPKEAAAMLLAGARLPGKGVRDRQAHEQARCSAYLQLAGIYKAQGKPQAALEVCQEALARAHTEPTQLALLHQRLADSYAELQQWQLAEQHQLLALQLQPPQAAVYASYGQKLAQNSSRQAEAEHWFQRALQLSPLEASAHHHYANFLDSQQRPQQALAYHLQAAALAPTNYALLAAVADALRLLNRLSEAELWYRKAALLQPHAAHAHANLGAILQMRGLQQQALDCYRRALQLQPGHATTRANLAKMNVNIETIT